MICVEHLTKEYKRFVHKNGAFSSFRNLFNREFEIVKAVDDISFDINNGEMVGFIGPNGAGKSTSIKMLTGILTPTYGKVVIDSINPHKERKLNAKQIGVVFGQKTQLWWDLPVIESLRLLRDIYKVSDIRFKNNMLLFNDMLELYKFQDTPVRQLSLGQRMRADLAAALLHDPKVLFLDEPTIGLDVITKERLRQFIKEINANNNVTVLLTTHDMSDIEKLCSRMIIINYGRIVYDGSVEQIRMQYGKSRILCIEFEDNVPNIKIPYCTLLKSEGKKLWIEFDKNEISSSKIITQMTENYQITDLTIQEPEIEEIVRSIFQDINTNPNGGM